VLSVPYLTWLDMSGALGSLQKQAWVALPHVAPSDWEQYV
jgi:hypothetical protein